MIRIVSGDCRVLLATLPAKSVHCCVTSPPYWGLRDYGTAQWDGGDQVCDHLAAATGSTQNKGNNGKFGAPFIGICGRCGARRIDSQIGLEATPDAYVAELVGVFREVRRVLRDDGTVWLNLGDSYSAHVGQRKATDAAGAKQRTNGASTEVGSRSVDGLKPKDLIGIPWRVAFALQQPYYAGKIKDERDRVWLAAMIDGEGCMYIHKRGEGLNNGQGYIRKNATFGAGLEIANTSEAVIRRCLEITGQGSAMRHDKDRRQPLWRWNMRTNECREIIREVYPYLVAKQQQARILLGCPSSGSQAIAAHEALIDLHGGRSTDVDFPPPSSMYEPGWYLRQDLIWAKSNPMPESVRDRCTKAHEYLFLLSKSPRYYFDAEAIAEPATFAGKVVTLGEKSLSIGQANGANVAKSGNALVNSVTVGEKRNRRSVWEIATQPFPGSHFAVFPPALIEPCILAGCPRECCAKCGAPWVREVERGLSNTEGYGPTKKDAHASIQGSQSMARNGAGRAGDPWSKTRGWSPSCSCNAGTVSGTVLDPFFGAGTTGLVADRLGRDCIGIELNPAYAKMATNRVYDDCPLFASIADQPDRPAGTSQLRLVP